VGTSALAIGIALHVATHYQGSVLYVADHLDGHEVRHRLLAQEGRIDLNPSPSAASGPPDVARWLERLDEPPRLIVIDRVTSVRPTPGGPEALSQLATVLLDLIDHHRPATLLVERTTPEIWFSCLIRGSHERPGSEGRWPPRASMARAMSASAEWNP
jgi:hypothetical protein